MVFVSDRGGGRRVEGVRRLLLSAAVAGLFGTIALHGAAAAFGAPADTIRGGATGPVELSTGSESPMFTLPALAPGGTASGYTIVRYDGAVAGSVRLYADVSDGGLAQHLLVTVTRGTGQGDGFTADADGVLFSGPLSTYPTDHAAAIVDPTTWFPGDARTYRFDVRLRPDADAAGLSAGAGFVWEARAL